MPAATSSRRGPSYRETSHAPSAPIPIPIHRKLPDQYDESSSPELIFHMSPHVADETPLSPSFIFNEGGARFNQKTGLTFASRFGHVKSPSLDLPPYYEEPFMYSIPRLPIHSPPSHARTRSEVVSPKFIMEDTQDDNSLPRSTFSASSSSLASSLRRRMTETDTRSSDTSDVVYDSQNPLISAFQNSLTSTRSGSHSPYPSTPLGDAALVPPISPPASIRGWKGFTRSARTSPARQRKSLDKAAGVGLIRSSAAEPVVSFAQAELKQSHDSVRATRVVKCSRSGQNSPRARSPYPVVRGRRSSLLRSRLKISDEDIVGTLENPDLSEKFGLEKFLAPGLARRRGLDENAPDEEPTERGRTKSRNRAGGRRG